MLFLPATDEMRRASSEHHFDQINSEPESWFTETQSPSIIKDYYNTTIMNTVPVPHNYNWTTP
jgi:hypothetical protein